MSGSEEGTPPVTPPAPDSGTPPQGEPQSPGQDPQFSVPSGYRLVQDSDYDRLSRAEQRARGADAEFGKIKELGYDSVGDALADLGHVSRVKQSGVGLDRLAGAFTPKEEEATGEPDFREVLNQTLDERFGALKRETAEDAYRKTVDSQIESIKAVSAELAEKHKLPPDLLRKALSDDLYNAAAATPFGEDHPLKGMANFDGAAERVVKAFEAEIAANAGKDAAAIATAAGKKPTSSATPAGNAGGQGGPENNEEDSEQARRDAARKLIDGRKAARAGSPTSQA